ncbi:MAG: TusE/DsrC/DsvC family sulfur relay protein [Oligoflexia bacterium]|nr:TusE/DsrC/DsvC family sulfur relay protein [Oligoflexia bacterium]
MKSMQVEGKDILFDKDGFMTEPSLWNEIVAKSIAKEEGIEEMTEEHWKVVNFIRNYWKENNLAPAVRLVCQEAGIGVRQLYKLFTSGPARGACRVAGLPKPDGCV